jgi:hypothetical protein
MSGWPNHYCNDEINNGEEHSKCTHQCNTCMLIEAGFKKQPEVNTICKCKDCLSGETALQKQLDHPFYKDAETFRNGVKMETLKKAAQKYPEPFNPASRTIEELAKHAMAENYDQQNYIYGMYERLQEQQENIEYQAGEIKRLEHDLKESRLAYKIVTARTEEERDELAKEFLTHYKGQFIDERI